MLPIAELIDGPATVQAWVIVEAYDEGSGRQFGLSRDRYLVIGAAESSLSVILLDLKSAPRVCWLAQGAWASSPPSTPSLRLPPNTTWRRSPPCERTRGWASQNDDGRMH